MELEDLFTDAESYFIQIKALLELMMEKESNPNLITLFELAESGLSKMKLIENNFIDE